MLARCKVCDVRKPKLHGGKRQGKNHVYVDEAGFQWSGKMCPDCHRLRCKRKYRALAGHPLDGPTIRVRDEMGKFMKRLICGL